jgi:hypothetical protein
MLLADCHLQMGENKKVIELMTPLDRNRPDDLGISYLLGTALVRDGQGEKGQVYIEKIMRRGDSAEARLLMGTTHMMIRSEDESKSAFGEWVAGKGACDDRKHRRGAGGIQTRADDQPH